MGGGGGWEKGCGEGAKCERGVATHVYQLIFKTFGPWKWKFYQPNC